VRTEQVPWARLKARHTSDFELLDNLSCPLGPDYPSGVTGAGHDSPSGTAASISTTTTRPVGVWLGLTHPFGLSNSRLEGINAEIRLVQRRGYGFRNLDAPSSAIYLRSGGITLTLPTER
jgi:Transposase